MTTSAAVPCLPTRPGVYRFRDERGRALYIGRASDLRRRVASYWGDLADRPHLRRMVPRVATIEAVPCASAHEAAWLERNLLERAKPYWNRVRGGQEVPVYIRLEPSGLRIIHDGLVHGEGRDFGPYLGGLKVRTAVSALGRILPLAYAGEWSSGSEREMARVLGVQPDAREDLAEAIALVLQRDPAACATLRAELESRRDAAAQRLSFEFAARLQAEIDAIDWVVAPQRVTRVAAGTVALHGWADGVLVSFQVRAGRVCTWTQQPLSATRAARYLSATPPEWVEFTSDAAELAGRLSAVR